MSKVLIYSFGWSGQSALKLFSAIGFDCCVVDDKMNPEWARDTRFITFEQVLPKDFDLVLICIINDKMANETLDKLIKISFQNNQIKLFQNYIYKDKISHLVKGFFGNTDDFVFDLNEVTKNSQESFFANHWIHCNARGNALCAQYVAQVLRQKEWL